MVWLETRQLFHPATGERVTKIVGDAAVMDGHRLTVTPLESGVYRATARATLRPMVGPDQQCAASGAG
jgi:hypothetical protein